MFKRLIISLCLALTAAPFAVAAPIHANDPDYRGAFTLLAAASASGASAKYSTEIGITNLSNHAVYIKLELYSTTGYREGVTVSTIYANGGSHSYWGGKEPYWEYTQILGEVGMGALRVVAVKANGDEDPTAVIHGYGRLWIEPFSGGRMSETIPALTDYEASGSLRRSHNHVGMQDFAPFIINTRPYATDLHDTTYGGSRMNVGLVNFDLEHDAVFEISGRDYHDMWGGTEHSDPMFVTVPAGSTRQVAVPILWYVGSNPPSIFPYATPLDTQVFNVAHSGGNDSWAAYTTVIDGATSSSTFFLDATTASRQ